MDDDLARPLVRAAVIPAQFTQSEQLRNIWLGFRMTDPTILDQSIRCSLVIQAANQSKPNACL